MQDFVAPHAIDARRCSAAGTKWLDNDADGFRDPGDLGLAGFRIYADLNENGDYDDDEPFAISDDRGDWVIDGITSQGEYTLREEPTRDVPGRGRWTCSHPAPDCSWTINAATEPYARDRDFGNWRPAHVTLIKQLDPSDDPGRFDLSVGDRVLAGAGDRDRRTFRVRPGSYPVTEIPAAGTDGAAYDSSVTCGEPSEPPQRTLGPTTTVTVTAGQHVECTFVNVRRGSPSVAITKVAPELAFHGATLDFELIVTNTGTVAFDAADVEVTDDRCDEPPELTAQEDGGGAPDATPGTLEPADVWTYACSRATSLPDPDGCAIEAVDNTGRVTVPGAADSDSTVTELLCPPPSRPDIAIQKVGPATAVAGTTLIYTLYVTNIGDVAFAEEDVTVTDPACDATPQLIARFDGSAELDPSPDRLDPGDVWLYRCTNATPAPGADCAPSTVTNTATVVATKRLRSVEDSDSADTPLTCPPGPPPVPPGPPQPPVDPSGNLPDPGPTPPPPDAGTAGVANLKPVRRCVRRGTRVIVRGSRIASIRVFTGGRRVGGLHVRALQRRAIVRVTRDLRPGRYRVRAEIRFQRGAGTAPVRLVRSVRVCAARAPRFTG